MFEKIKSLFASSDSNSIDIESWNNNGFLILSGFLNKSELSAFDNEMNEIYTNRVEKSGEITIDILEGDSAGKRLKLSDATNEDIKCVHKVNDLYLESNGCRNLNLNSNLRKILEKLLGDAPLVINSLSFKKGSQQPHHFDTYYMPPPVKNKMVVTSICLEDQAAETGPLSYYPGSHKIKPYVFSHGGIHAIQNEMESATQYIQAEIKKLRLKKETFIGKAGDIFIWHAQLYHGGLPIKDHIKTRKTLVTHYWRESDVENERVANFEKGGSYLLKEHQSV